MAIYNNGYLNNVTDQSFRDWQHAARLYVDDTYRLAPKPKWLHYAVFNINKDALGNTAFQDQNRRELNYLVKKMELPKYTLNTENLNQYNRKTTSYTKITYDPVNITFHDDNNGVTNAMWALYYGYYFADRLNSSSPYQDIAPAAYKPHVYDTKDKWPYRYGLDNGIVDPFFDSIQLITLTKQKFTSYLLCNPKIISWQHDTMDQSEGAGVVENNMSVAYDAVIYTTGYIETDNPSGFAILHYDQSQSPLGPDNGTFAQGVNSIGNTFPDLYNQNSFNPVDLGISLLSNILANPYVGNQLPYGYGNDFLYSNDYGVYRSPYTTSGFQNYNFSSGFGYTPSALNNVINNSTTNNINVNNSTINNYMPIKNAPIDESYVSVPRQREQAINNEYSATIRGANPINPPITSDAYTTNLPRNDKSSRESYVFGNINSGVALPETPGPVDMQYFTQNDSANRITSTNELINNNPQNPDIPSTPFQ